jgi:hypothetical protein
MDPGLAILVVVFLAIVLLAPIIGTEDRPGFKRPDRKPRPFVGSMREADWEPWDLSR